MTQPQAKNHTTQPEGQQRLSIAMLKERHDKYRHLASKSFVHTKSGESYQFLFTCFDEATNEVNAVYVLSAMPWLKFNRPIEEFLSKFHERGSV
jgi:hypothetical protein